MSKPVRVSSQRDARTLARAEGVLVALRRCTIVEAFHEIVDASHRHRVPPLRVARALVAVAEQDGNSDHSAVAVARYEWGSLLDPEAVAT